MPITRLGPGDPPAISYATKAKSFRNTEDDIKNVMKEILKCF